jgi:hypothetical protein
LTSSASSANESYRVEVHRCWIARWPGTKQQSFLLNSRVGFLPTWPRLRRKNIQSSSCVLAATAMRNSPRSWSDRNARSGAISWIVSGARLEKSTCPFRRAKEPETAPDHPDEILANMAFGLIGRRERQAGRNERDQVDATVGLRPPCSGFIGGYSKKELSWACRTAI